MNAQMEMKNMLSEEELFNVTGGRTRAKARPRSRSRARGTSVATAQMMNVECTFCHEPFGADVSCSKVLCPYCGEVNTFAG